MSSSRIISGWSLSELNVTTPGSARERPRHASLLRHPFQTYKSVASLRNSLSLTFALHWLPIRQRIQFKLLLLVYRCTHQLAPDYLTDLVVPYVPARSLRSADQNLLTVKRYNLERYGRRSFSVAGPSLWNALPSAIRNSVSLPAFRSSLKTHLFREAFVTNVEVM